MDIRTAPVDGTRGSGGIDALLKLDFGLSVCPAGAVLAANIEFEYLVGDGEYQCAGSSLPLKLIREDSQSHTKPVKDRDQ